MATLDNGSAQLASRRTVPLVVGAAALGLLVSWLLTRAMTPETVNLFADWSGPLWLSLRVAGTALALGGTCGIASGYVLAHGRFLGRDLLEALGSIPLILPPTVLGYLLLQSLDGTSLGGLLTRLLGQDPVFGFWGCVIAASIAAYPFCLRASRAAFAGVETRLEDVGLAMGLTRPRVALEVSLPLARHGVTVGLTLGFLRALGEFGATLMIGGAILGRTTTLPIAVTNATSIEVTHAILGVLVTIAILALVCVGWLERR